LLGVSVLLRNGFYNIVAALTRLGIQVLSIPLIIKFIGVEEYGLWSLVMTIIAFAYLVEGGVTNSIIFFVSKDIGCEDHQGVLITIVMTGVLLACFSIFIATSLWFFAPVSFKYFSYFSNLNQTQINSLIKSSQFGGIYTCFYILQRLPIAIEQVYQRYGQMNLINTLYSFLNTAGLLFVVWKGGHSVQMMEWQVVTNFAFLIIHICVVWQLINWQLFKTMSVKSFFVFKKIREIIRYSLINWCSGFTSVLFNHGDRLIIALSFGTYSLGIYAAIGNIVSQIQVFVTTAVQPISPKLASLLGSSDSGKKDEINQTVKQAFHLNIYLSVLLGSAIFIFSELINKILLPGVPTTDSVPVMRITAIIYTLYSMSIVGYFVLLVTKSAFEGLMIQICSTLICLLLIFWGSKTGSLRWAVMGNVGYLSILWVHVLAMQKLNIQPREWLRDLPVSLTCLLGISVTSLLLPNDFNFPVGGVLFFVEAFILSIWYLRANPSVKFRRTSF
jgi:O-antigen/teichoic acid export membrane protein